MISSAIEAVGQVSGIFESVAAVEVAGVVIERDLVGRIERCWSGGQVGKGPATADKDCVVCVAVVGVRREGERRESTYGETSRVEF